MTIFVIWQLIVTLDSIRNSCDVYSFYLMIFQGGFFLMIFQGGFLVTFLMISQGGFGLLCLHCISHLQHLGPVEGRAGGDHLEGDTDEKDADGADDDIGNI